MGTLKKYRFKLAWQNFRVGAIIEPTGTVRDWLVSNGYIEPVVEAVIPPTPEPVTESPAQPVFTHKRSRASRDSSTE